MNIRLSLAAASVCLAMLPAAAEIYRCAEKGSAVTYQEFPCPDQAVGQRANVPTEFPPVNTEARDRLFAKEEAMYRRLEAQRDRDLQESVLRDAAAERELERKRLALQEQQQQQVYGIGVVGYPMRPLRPQARPPIKRSLTY